MKPLYVRELTTEEIETLKQELRSPSAFTVRRSQILLKSYEGQKAQAIGKALHCSDQTVRDAIRAFNKRGLVCLTEKSHARHDQVPLIDAVGCARLEELIRLSPRTFGHDTSVWTRPLLAQQLHAEGTCGQGSKCDIHQQRLSPCWHILATGQEVGSQPR